MDNIVDLHVDLVNRTYCHGPYKSFYITDPKRRHIHKASVRDRLLHHAVYRILYPFFDKSFIADSFSCRNEKGMHRAVNRFRKMALQVSKNNHRSCWVLKCDIKKFFASIDHEILLSILRECIPNKDIIKLLENIIGSFCTDMQVRVGLPLGNLTSQLFSNVYLNNFDQWVKHNLKAKYYIRYADDFVFLDADKSYLQIIIPHVQDFLQTNLKISLHSDKLFLKTVASGLDFLGWVNFSNYRLLRTKTKQRMFKKIRQSASDHSMQSYLGMLVHGNTAKIRRQAEVEHWLWQ